MIRQIQTVGLLFVIASGLAWPLQAEDTASLAEAVALLRQQNQQLLEQLQRQNAAIDALTQKVASLEQKTAASASDQATTGGSGFSTGKLHVTGEGGVGYFSSGKNGAYPNSEFRVDEAKLFLDASVWKDVFAFAEINLATREDPERYLYLGEAYLDFEDVSTLWNQPGMLSLRAGRMDVPFGEEYLHRDAIDNPLISHSVQDFWGVDAGLELYGGVGGVNYVLAIQNGGTSPALAVNADKSVALRVSGDPLGWLHLSASAMRTGDQGVNELSTLWIGNGFFKSIGGPGTSEFHANLAQGDVRVRLPHGHLQFSGGFARYDDNDPAADNQRDFWFYSAEGVQDLSSKLYAAARFSGIQVNGGYPLIGQGTFGNYFNTLTEELWRLSLGLGYRFSENLVLKAEYSFERGHQVGGQARNQEDMFSTAAAFKF